MKRLSRAILPSLFRRAAASPDGARPASPRPDAAVRAPRSILRPLALEQRFMFDGAAGAEAAQAAGKILPTLDALHTLHATQALHAPGLDPQVIREVAPLLNGGRREVVFIDSGLPDYQSLVQGVRSGVEVVLLAPGQDGLAQMAAWASRHQGYAAIHLFSHGEAGRLTLGSEHLDLNRLQDENVRRELAQLGKALTADGDLLLYGCDVAQGTKGSAFIERLAQLTAADVAASRDTTGLWKGEGNWVLEATTGLVGDSLAISGYDHRLATETLSVGGATVNGSGIGPSLGAELLSGEAASSSGNIEVYFTDRATHSKAGLVYLLNPPNAGYAGGSISVYHALDSGGTNYSEAKDNGGQLDATSRETEYMVIRRQDGSSFALQDLAVTWLGGGRITLLIEGMSGGLSTGSITYALGAASNITQSFASEISAAGTKFTNVDMIRVTGYGYLDSSYSNLQGNTIKILDTAMYVAFNSVTLGDVAVVGPTVTDANISITSTGSGTGGAYKIGDTVTATWNNTAAGDNNAGVTGVTMDFSQFGGSTAVTATNSGNTWTASYVIAAGSVDTTARNVKVSATDGAGTRTTADTTNLTVDNIAPTATDGNLSISGATGTGGAYKIGDTITATWNNTAAGDNNTDTISAVTFDFSAFGGGSAVAATNSGGTWTATYTLVAGAIDSTNRNVSVTVTDNAGNTKTTADTSNATVDIIAPTVTDSRITISGATGTGGAYKIGDTITATWNNTAGGDNNTDTINAVTFDFSAFGGGSAVAATNSAGTWTATYTLVAGALNGVTNRNVSVTVTDNAGNTRTTADTSNATVDSQAPASTAVTVPADSTYGAGSNWDFTVTFDQAVTVSGSPRIDLTVGSTTRQAVYVSGSGTSALVFRYTTQTGDNDSDGIAIGGSITPAGGTLKDAAGNDATLTLNGIASTAGVKIATNFLPTLSSLGTLSGASEDTERAISLADLAAAGNEADADGTVTAFVVKAVSSGSLRIGTDAASATAWNAATNAVIDATHQAYWTPAANANGNLNAFTVVARDNAGGDSLTPVQVVLNATAINDAPTLAVNGGLTLNEGDTATLDAGHLAASDPDDSGTGLTYTVTAAPGHGRLELSGNPGVAVSSFTQDDLDNNRLRYVHDGGESSSDSFTFTLADGGENGAAALSGQTFAITINPVNDAPAISQLGGDSQSYLMASGPRLIDQGALPGLTDVDSSNFAGGTLTVAITANRVSAEDVLAIRHQGNGAGQIGISGGNVSYGGILIGTATGGSGTDDLVVTFNANADATAVAALLANITYENVNTTACTASIRSVSFTLTDGDGGTAAPQVATVDVSQNTPPTATDGSVTLNEDTAHVFSAAAFHFSDADGGDSLQSIRITQLPAAGSLSLAGAAVTLNQVISAADIAAGKLQFSPAADANGAAYAQFQFQVSDGKSYSTAHTLTLNVTAVDDAPTLAAVPGTRYTDTAANDVFATHSGTLSGQDKDGEPLTYGIQGATPAGGTATLAGRYGTLSLNTATGAYTYTPNDSAINALSSAASDPFTFTVSDGHTLVSTTFTVDLVGTNDAPVLATPTPLHYTDTAATDTFAAQNGSLTATDKDGTATLTYGLAGATISGTTATLAGRYGTLTLDTRSGAYRYQPNPGAINALSGPAEETFTLSVSDGNASSDARLTVAIAGADDAPSGRVSIGGAPVAGGTLTVQQNLQDAEGMGAVSLQWQAGDGHGGWVDIAGATGSQLTVSADLAGKAIRALASYPDGAGNATVVASSATEAVSNVPPPPVPVTVPSVPAPPGVVPAPTETPPSAPPLPPVVFLPSTSSVGLQQLTASSDSLAGRPTPEQSGAQGREAPSELNATPSQLTRPAPGSFQVVVAPRSPGLPDNIVVNRPLKEVVLPADSLEMTVPVDTFAHTNPQATVELTIRRADGRPLPSWASFDPRTGKLKLQLAPGTRGELALRLVARDAQGHEAATTFRVVFGHGEEHALDAPSGRVGLNEQLRNAGQLSGLPEGLAARFATTPATTAPAQA
jgi:hypothetical protein